jgi:hypothetical protein
MNSKAWMVAAALLSAGVAQATCFSVYRADGTLIQEGPNTPVNLAVPLGDSVPEKFGEGASLTMSGLDYHCKQRKGPAAVRKVKANVKASAEGSKRAKTAANQEPAKTAATEEPAKGEVETAAAP